jgi:hypothetical protein
MKNFFMVYRPFHFDYSVEIIRTHFVSAFNVLVDHYQHPYASADMPSSVTVLSVKQSGIKRIRALRSAARALRNAAKSGETVNVFIPHTLGVLSNYSYHTLSVRYPNVKVNVYYEGVIAFYGYRHSYFTNFRYYLSRWVASAFSGLRYTFENRLLDFHDARIHGIYTPFPAIDAPDGKVIYTPLRKVIYEPREDTCVILGLKLSQGQEEDMYRIINAIYDKVGLLGITNIYYKDHPAEESPDFLRIAGERHINLKVINDKSPVENLVIGLHPRYVFSIWSSGLVNLRHILPDDTEVFSFLTSRIAGQGDIGKLVQAFRENGVQVCFV